MLLFPSHEGVFAPRLSLSCVPVRFFRCARTHADAHARVHTQTHRSVAFACAAGQLYREDIVGRGRDQPLLKLCDMGVSLQLQRGRLSCRAGVYPPKPARTHTHTHAARRYQGGRPLKSWAEIRCPPTARGTRCAFAAYTAACRRLSVAPWFCTGGVCGTPMYTAPEVHDGRRYGALIPLALQRPHAATMFRLIGCFSATEETLSIAGGPRWTAHCTTC